eukprot:1424019-Rhodomonas_salina.1
MLCYEATRRPPYTYTELWNATLSYGTYPQLWYATLSYGMLYSAPILGATIISYGIYTELP